MSVERMHVLLGSDDSIAARAAEAWATNLSWTERPEVRVLTVAAPTIARVHWLDRAPHEHLLRSLAEADAVEQKRAAEVAEAVAKRVRAAGLDAHPTVRQGEAAYEILRELDESGTDLVVLGPRGRSEFATALLGGVTQQVLTHSRVPVLVARSAGVPAGRLPQTVLLLVNGTLAIRGAIEWLTRAGWLRQARVVISGLLGRPSGLSTETLELEDSLRAQLRLAAEDTLSNLADLVRRETSDVTVDLRFGHPLQTALAAADEHQADLLVVGRRPPRPGDQPFADKVARYASVSVLLVPAADSSPARLDASA